MLFNNAASIYLSEEIISQCRRSTFIDCLRQRHILLIQLGHRPKNLQHAIHITGITKILQPHEPALSTRMLINWHILIERMQIYKTPATEITIYMINKIRKLTLRQTRAAGLHQLQ